MKQQEINDAIQRHNETILDRKARLSKTDYIAAKIAEGVATREDYQKQLAERQRWRNEINAASVRIEELEGELPEEAEAAERPAA